MGRKIQKQNKTRKDFQPELMKKCDKEKKKKKQKERSKDRSKEKE